MKTSLELKFTQQLAMTPQLQQAIKLLQLSSVDLQHEITQMLESNPMLDTDEIESSATSAATEDTDTAEKKKEVVVEEYESPWSEPSQSTRQWQGDEQQSTLENTPSDSESLQDYLTWQINLCHLSEVDTVIAEYLIESINDIGYLTAEVSDIHHSLDQCGISCDEDEIIAVLHRIQHLDPIGVGARTLSECLTIQAKQYYQESDVLSALCEIIDNYLKEVSKNQLEAISKKTKFPHEVVTQCVEIIHALNPKPGNEIGQSSPEYIVPDAYVSKVSDQWVVKLNFEHIPKLKLNNHYTGLVHKAGTARDSQYFKTQLQEARWFLKSLENRQDTLKRVITCIVEKQQDFLEKGEEGMHPMTLSDVADTLSLHESTISRVTTKKYLHTPRGVFELKYFFPSHIKTHSGESLSATAIRAAIKKLIAAEDPHKPLSDSQLEKELSKKGIKIARRTIAKYREHLGILPSHDRKQHA